MRDAILDYVGSLPHRLVYVHVFMPFISLPLFDGFPASELLPRNQPSNQDDCGLPIADSDGSLATVTIFSAALSLRLCNFTNQF